ncbi:MAG: ComEA family DNA-binding protein [Bacillota bacterium]
MFKLTPKEQKLLILLAFLLILGVVLRFALPAEKGIAVLKGGGETPAGSIAGGEKDAASAVSAAAAAVEKDVEEKMIVIHVAGAVSRPGVYHLPAGSRVYEALDQAGGGLAEADLDRINLAQPLVDGQQVYFPLKGEEGLGPLAGSGVSSAGRININTAGREQLESLPGIGAVKAQNIINYRQQNGPFHSIEDLLEVSGIGTKTLEGIRDLITVW